MPNSPTHALISPSRATPGFHASPRLTGGINTNRRYWVGGTSTYALSANWSLTSGGAGGASVPTVANDVIFDANSGSGTCTVGATGAARSLDFTGYTGGFKVGPGIAMQIGDSGGGALKLSSTMTLTATTAASNFQFISTNSNGGVGWPVTMAGKTWGGAITFGGAGGRWQLADASTVSGAVTHTAGILDLNNQTCTWTLGYSCTGASARTLNAGSSAVSISNGSSGVWTISGSLYQLSCDSMTINFTSVVSFNSMTTGAKVTYGTVNYSAAAVSPSLEAKITGGDNVNPTVITNLNITGSTAANSPAGFAFGVNLSAFTVTNLTIAGADSSTPVWVSSAGGAASAMTNTGNTAFSFTVTNSPTLTDVFFTEITAAGPATPWSGTRLGDGQGNTNITFPTGQTNYWVGGTGNWSDVNHWASSSGGSAASGRIPLAQDDVRFDANSGSGTSTFDRFYLGKGWDFTSSTVTSIVHSGFPSGAITWGGITQPSNVTFTVTSASSGQNFYFSGRQNYTIDTNGTLWGNRVQASGASTALVFNNLGGTITFGSDFWTLAPILFGNGSSIRTGSVFDANGKNITAYSFADQATTAARTVAFGSGTWSFTALSGSVLTIPNQANLTLTGSPTFSIPETADGVVSGGAYRIPQPGTPPTNTTIVPAITPQDNHWHTWPANSLTGDIDIRVKLKRDFWTDAGNAVCIIGKQTASPGLQWIINCAVSGTLTFQASTNGASTPIALSPSSTGQAAIGNGVAGWIRFTRVASTGAYAWYYSLDATNDPTAVTWTSWGSGTGTSGTLFNSTSAPLVIGHGASAATTVKGLSYYYAGVSSSTSVWTPVATIDFTGMEDYALSYTDVQSNVWRSYQSSSVSTGARRILGGAYTNFTSVNGDAFYTPDSAALSITGDIDIMVRARSTIWSSTTGTFVGKKSSITTVSYTFDMSGAGLPRLTLSPDGTTTNQVAVSSSATLASVGIVNGQSTWLRATWRQSDGRLQFFYAADSSTVPSSWTQLGTDRSLVVASIFDSTANVEIGTTNVGTLPFIGDIHRVRILNGIGGTVVFDADFSSLQDDVFAFRETSTNRAIVHHGNTSNQAGLRTIVTVQITGKTVPGTISTSGSGRILYLLGITTPTYPAVTITGPRWVQSGQSQNITLPSLQLVSTSTGPRSAYFSAAENAVATTTSGGTINVQYADIYMSTAAGASIPFHDIMGFDGGQNTNWLFDQLVTQSDSVGVSDNQLNAGNGITSDSQGLTEAVVSSSDVFSSESESLSDSYNADSSVVNSESLGLTDTNVASVDSFTSDSSGLSDSNVPSADSVFSDTNNLSDSSKYTVDVNTAESMGITDAILSSIEESILDSLALLDSAIADQNLSIDDILNLLDNIDADRVAGVTQEVISDSMGIIDSYGSGNFPGTGNYPGAENYPGTGDYVSLVIATAAVALSDSEGGSDQALLDVSTAIRELIGILDPAAKALDTFTSDNEGLTDAYDPQRGSSVGDDLGQTDSSFASVNVGKLELEGLTDPQLKSIEHVMSDLFGMSDAATASVVVSLTDANGITDSAFAQFSKSISEFLSTSDAVVSDLTVALVDQDGISDTAVVEFGIDINELIDLSDILEDLLTIGKQHIHVDTMVVKIGQNLINISAQQMPITISVESFDLTQGADEAITEPPAN